jgi:cytochrome c-type biogenesis protein CcmH
MLLWLSFACLGAVVLVGLLHPLLRAVSASADGTAADLAVYRDQLAEVDADLARGLIGEVEAKAARTELARRLLARSGAASSEASRSTSSGASPPVSGFASYPVLIAALALMPAAALILYQSLGAPGLPSRPYAVRAAAPVASNSVDELVARVEARLREQPEDGAGWDVIAPVYLRQQRYREAADAYSSAIRLLGPNVKRLAGFAEASIVAANGVVGEEAKSAYEQILREDPRHVEARFWLAMSKEQDGAFDAAAADYRAMLDAASEGAPWRGAVVERHDELMRRLGRPPFAPSADADRGRGAAPDAAAAGGIASLSPAEQRQAIAGMVDGLAARLKENGADLEGWLRLLRAYKVLGRDEAALLALSDARKAMQGNAAALSEIDALAKSLGMGS